MPLYFWNKCPRWCCPWHRLGAQLKQNATPPSPRCCKKPLCQIVVWLKMPIWEKHSLMHLRLIWDGLHPFPCSNRGYAYGDQTPLPNEKIRASCQAIKVGCFTFLTPSNHAVPVSVHQASFTLGQYSPAQSSRKTLRKFISLLPPQLPRTAFVMFTWGLGHIEGLSFLTILETEHLICETSQTISLTAIYTERYVSHKVVCIFNE